jgi:hypothetical protein
MRGVNPWDCSPNVTVSVFEDVSVAGLVLLAVKYPIVAVVVVAVLAVGATALTVWLWEMARRAMRRVGTVFKSLPGTRSSRDN